MTEQELKVVIQGVLDGEVIQLQGLAYTGFNDLQNRSQLSTMELVLKKHHFYTFRIKPEPFRFTYRTRAYFLDGRVAVWNSYDNVSQKTFEESSIKNYVCFRWLEDTQEHTVRYELENGVVTVCNNTTNS